MSDFDDQLDRAAADAAKLDNCYADAFNADAIAEIAWVVTRTRELMAQHPEWDENQIRDELRAERDAAIEEANQTKTWQP